MTAPNLPQDRRFHPPHTIDPASQRPLWGVYINSDEPETRARYVAPRRVTSEERERFLVRRLGRDPD